MHWPGQIYKPLLTPYAAGGLQFSQHKIMQ